jgi:hypothetical protein
MSLDSETVAQVDTVLYEALSSTVSELLLRATSLRARFEDHKVISLE